MSEITQDHEPDPVLVILDFRTRRPAELTEILSRYVVLSRGRPGCRNIDFTVSATDPGRIVVVEKWDSAARQRAHLDAEETVTMAADALPLLAAEPDIDLFVGISMHDRA